MAESDDRPAAGSPAPTSAGPAGFIDGFLRSPFAGIAPWILLSVLSGPGRFEEAVAAALGFAVLVLWVGHRRGIPVHLLELFSVAYFAVLAVVGAVASVRTVEWLELWAGELTNVMLATFAVVTLLIRRPFTLAYAKDTTAPEFWDSPLFLRINYVISAVWAGAFTVAAIVGFIGDAVLRDAGNFWTGWILQLAAMFFAVSFTEFYPDYATAKYAPEAGEKAPPILKVLDWLPSFVLVTGIVGLVTDSVDGTLGWVLIAVGVVGSALVHRLLPNPDAANPSADSATGDVNR